MDQLDRIRHHEYQITSAEHFMSAEHFRIVEHFMTRWSVKSYVKQSKVNRAFYRLDDIDSRGKIKHIIKRYFIRVSKKGQYHMKCKTIK